MFLRDTFASFSAEDAVSVLGFCGGIKQKAFICTAERRTKSASQLDLGLDRADTRCWGPELPFHLYSPPLPFPETKTEGVHKW